MGRPGRLLPTYRHWYLLPEVLVLGVESVRIVPVEPHLHQPMPSHSIPELGYCLVK